MSRPKLSEVRHHLVGGDWSNVIVSCYYKHGAELRTERIGYRKAELSGSRFAVVQIYFIEYSSTVHDREGKSHRRCHTLGSSVASVRITRSQTISLDGIMAIVPSQPSFPLPAPLPKCLYNQIF